MRLTLTLLAAFFTATAAGTSAHAQPIKKTKLKVSVRANRGVANAGLIRHPNWPSGAHHTQINLDGLRGVDKDAKKLLVRLLKATVGCINTCRNHGDGETHWCEGPAAKEMLQAFNAITAHDSKADEGKRIIDLFHGHGTQKDGDRNVVVQLGETKGGKILYPLGLRDVGCQLSQERESQSRATASLRDRDACFAWVSSKPKY